MRFGLLLLIVAAGCGDDTPELAQRAAEVRELELLELVPVIEMTREEFAAQAEANADEIDEAVLAEYADTYGRLGFFPIDADLRPIFAGSSSDWVGAQYSPWAKRITLVGDVPDDTVVHEWVHALQDQHFDLAEYDGATSDAFLARRAVVEGDAVLAQYRFFVEEEYGVDLDGLDWADLLDKRRVWGTRFLTEADYPVFFLDYPSFVYVFGLEYVANNLLGVTIDDPVPAPAPHDWSREDALYTERPPASVQQVLRRDADVDAIEEVGLDAVPEALADRFEAIDWDTLGEWYVYLLFYGLDGSEVVPDARALAATWDGDKVLFVRDLETGAAATVWTTAWDDEAAAAAAMAALAALYGHDPVRGEPLEMGWAADGEQVWLEQRGNRVVAAKNLAADIAPEVIEAAFGPAAMERKVRLRAPLGLRLRPLD